MHLSGMLLKRLTADRQPGRPTDKQAEQQIALQLDAGKRSTNFPCGRKSSVKVRDCGEGFKVFSPSLSRGETAPSICVNV